MPQAVKPIPDGFHVVTPYLVVRGADQAIRFYKEAFGAVEVARFPSPDGKSIMHAAIKVGDSMIYLSDEFPQWGSRSPQTLGGVAGGNHLYVEDVDASLQKAVAAGAQVRMPPSDQFWGDRFAKITDPFGQEWSLATHKEDVAPEEMGRRAKAFFAQAAKQPS